MRSWKYFIISFVVAMGVFGFFGYSLTNNVISYRITENNQNNPSNNSIETDDSGNSTSSLPISPSKNNEQKTDEENKEITKATFLFVGTDYQPSVIEYEESRFDEDGFYVKEKTVSADSLLLLKIDKEKKTVYISSIPSNAVLNKATNKTVGSMYSEYGRRYMTECVFALTGIRAEHLAVISVEDCVNALGKLGNFTYNVPCDMKYEDPWQNYSIDLKAGVQTLTPKQVVDMLRFKDFPAGSKLTREKVMIDFSQALLSKVTSPAYLTGAVSMFGDVLGFFETEFTIADFTDRLDLIFGYKDYTVKVITYPGYTKKVDGRDLFYPKIDEAIGTYSELK